MRIITATVLAFSISACSTYQSIDVPQPEPSVVIKEKGATAGAVSVDITPPPGMPMSGYSIMANRGIGFRTRIKARAFYLNDGNGQPMALVQTDLAASSILLHHKVSALVAEKTHLKPGDIAITGSHSHSSMANHFDHDFYNKHMSSGQGLEPEFLAFVSQRIADGIIEAYETRRPAKVATGRKDIYGYNRNRALEAYVLNKGKEGIDLEDPESRFKAVNPALFMIRVDALDDDGKYKPLGAFSSFSVHATSMSVPVEVYNADLFAYAQKDLEWAIKAKYQPSWNVVHGLTTGTQGDMAPALPDNGDYYIGHAPVNWIESRKLGKGIGKEAIELFESLGPQLSAKLTLGTAAREINISENNVVEDVELCQTPYVGNPVAAGAYERRTPWLTLIPFFKGGTWASHRWWFGKDGCQGTKRILGTSLIQPFLEPTESFPNTVLFQIMRINDTVVLPLPFEITTESGHRISERVKAEFANAGDPIKHSWVTSVSNGYFGYSTTPEEYAYQNYEGGHTLYGQYSTPYITAQLGLLAQDLHKQGDVEELYDAWSYYLKTNSFLPEQQDATGTRSIIDQPEVIAAQNDNEEDYMVFRWVDVGPSKINFHNPLGRIDVKTATGWETLSQGNHVINDDGYDIEVRFLGEEDNGMGEYEMRWYNPKQDGQYRFVVEAREGQSLLNSKSFTR